MAMTQTRPDIETSELRNKVLGCWLGKAVGGTLGQPYEGDPGPLDLSFYRPVPTEMIPNDDLDLQVVWACVLDRMGKHPTVSRHVLADAWRDNIEFPFDEYGVAKRNLALGLAPPVTGSYDNAFAHGMGAAIRSEVWACLAAGDPELAAAYAYEDACVDHAGEGVHAEVFLAALEAAAFVEADRDTLLDRSLDTLPTDSTVRQAIADTRQWWDADGDWHAVRRRIVERYGHENFTDVTQNLAFTVLGWLAGGGDFGRSICIAVNCGADTDCTGATLGALLGILDPDGIPQKWLDPIGRDLVLSPGIVGIDPPDTLDGFTDLVLSLRERLDGSPPAPAPEEAGGEAKPSRCRSCRWRWVSATCPAASPWAAGRPRRCPTTRRHVEMPGAVCELPYERLTRSALLLRYRFTLNEAREVKVMFNTPQDMRLWVNGKYTLGREAGMMRPAFHHGPLHQVAKVTLDAGEHELFAVVRRPMLPEPIRWVVGVADAKTNLWLADALHRPVEVKEPTG